MNSLEEFVEGLDLPFSGEYRDNSYNIELNNSNDFSTLFNSVDLNKDLHLSGSSKATEKESKFRFTDGYHEVVLEANYDKDIYKLKVEGK